MEILIQREEKGVAFRVISDGTIKYLTKNCEIINEDDLKKNDDIFFDSDNDMIKAFDNWARLQESEHKDSEDEDFVVGNQYKHLTIDTVEWSKANHTIEQQKAICQFMINKYSMRNKGQFKDDIVKIRFYTDWLNLLISE